jgi:glycosyltransferase involved in cell wall biosynthesis
MRVLLLTSAFPPTAGGAETYALNLALGVGARGHPFHVITNAAPGLPSYQKLAANVSVSRLEAFRKRLEAPDRVLWEEMQFSLCPEVEEIARDVEPDIVYSNNLGLCAIAKITSIALQKPWVASFHEQSPEREAFGDARLHFAYGDLKPDMVIAGSQFYLARALRYGNPDKTHLVYHGIDLNQFHERSSSKAIRVRYNVPSDFSLLVSAGRLKPRKGLIELIDAIDLLRSRDRKLFLIIAGSISSASAEYRTQLRTLVAERGLASSVAFEESADHSMMPALFSAADVVVQPSLEEGLGLAVIEAMACARAVVTTRIPGIMEIVTRDEIASLVEPGSVGPLAAAIDALLRDNTRRLIMGANARRHVETYFSRETMSARTCDLLISLESRLHSHR